MTSRVRVIRILIKQSTSGLPSPLPRSWRSRDASPLTTAARAMERGIDMKKRKRWLLPFLLFLFLVVATAFVKWGSFGRLSDFDVGVADDGDLNVALERIRDKQGLPALAAVLIHRGKIVETGAVGVRAVGSPEPFTRGSSRLPAWRSSRAAPAPL